MNQPSQFPQGQPQPPALAHPGAEPRPIYGSPYPPVGPMPGSAPYPPPKKGLSTGVIILLIVVVGVVVGGPVLVGILAVAFIPRISAAKESLELKQMGDINAALRTARQDHEKAGRLKSPEFATKAGFQFWESALQAGVIDPDLSFKLVSLLSKSDSKASATELRSNNCSFTAPRSRELGLMLTAKDPRRVVWMTWNSRNWRNANGEKSPRSGPERRSQLG